MKLFKYMIVKTKEREMELSPNEQSALFSLNGFWSQIRCYLPKYIQHEGLNAIAKITEKAIYFRDKEDFWQVRIDNKEVTKLDTNQITLIGLNK